MNDGSRRAELADAIADSSKREDARRELKSLIDVTDKSELHGIILRLSRKLSHRNCDVRQSTILGLTGLYHDYGLDAAIGRVLFDVFHGPPLTVRLELARAFFPDNDIRNFKPWSNDKINWLRNQPKNVVPVFEKMILPSVYAARSIVEAYEFSTQNWRARNWDITLSEVEQAACWLDCHRRLGIECVSCDSRLRNCSSLTSVPVYRVHEILNSEPKEIPMPDDMLRYRRLARGRSDGSTDYYYGWGTAADP